MTTCRFQPGTEPRGVVQPAIAYALIGVAVGLAVAGAALDELRARRARRRVLVLVRRMEVTPR
jgi:biopolymer transport protein ExbB/TolQ